MIITFSLNTEIVLLLLHTSDGAKSGAYLGKDFRPACSATLSSTHQKGLGFTMSFNLQETMEVALEELRDHSEGRG